MSCADSPAEMATDYYYLTVMQLHSAWEAEYSGFSLVRDFCRLPKDDFFFFFKPVLCGAAMRPSPLIPSCFLLLLLLLIAHSLSFFLSQGDTYLRFAPLSSAHFFP